MRKENLYKFFYFVAGMMAAAFCVRVAADIFFCNESQSVPFRMMLSGRIVQFVIPGLLAFLAARVAKKKYNGDT